MKLLRLALFSAAVVSPLAIAAQDIPVAPAPPPKDAAPPSGTSNPAVQSLMQSDGIGRADAEERIGLQADILALLESTALTSDPGFVELVVVHKPVYQVILSFADNSDKAELLKSVPAKLRRYVKVRKAKHDRGQRAGSLSALSKAVGGTGKSLPIGYDSIAERYFVEVPDEAARSQVTAVVPPGIAADVDVLITEIPTKEQSQSTTATPAGVRAGDWAAAGYRSTSTAASTNPGAPCTLAYPVTFGTNLRGILTAGHCTEPKYIHYADHDVTFTSAYIERDSGKYDFAIYRTDGLNTDYQLYYWNRWGIPEFPASGWLRTKNFIRGANLWVGMSICVSGSVNGLACGKIVTLPYLWNGDPNAPYVLVSNTAQGDLNQPGDSGAATFAYVDPRTSVDISATGIHVGGSGTGSTAREVFMPIDRIFEVGVTNLKLITTPP